MQYLPFVTHRRVAELSMSFNVMVSLCCSDTSDTLNLCIFLPAPLLCLDNLRYVRTRWSAHTLTCHAEYWDLMPSTVTLINVNIVTAHVLVQDVIMRVRCIFNLISFFKGKNYADEITMLCVPPHIKLWTSRTWLQWPRGLSHQMFSASPALGSWVWIPLEAWPPVCVSPLFLLSCVGRGLVMDLAPIKRVLPTLYMTLGPN
jgi:hypothetical protein